MIRKLACILSLCLLAASAAAQETVIVRPKPIDDVLVNPGMGIETFQRFNGQALNAGLGWSEEGPTAKLSEGTSASDFPGSSISYCRWFWQELEPEQGKVRWEIIDQALSEAHAHGQALAIRLMPYDQKHPLPVWYQNSGARRANRPTDKDGDIWQPDFSDSLYLKHWGAVVAEAGARYVVVSTQGRGDEAALLAALAIDSAYVAFVGSRKKADALKAALSQRGVPAERLAKLKAPAGLDLGAITPDEIAISILAEIVAARRQSMRG